MSKRLFQVCHSLLLVILFFVQKVQADTFLVGIENYSSKPVSIASSVTSSAIQYPTRKRLQRLPKSVVIAKEPVLVKVFSTDKIYYLTGLTYRGGEVIYLSLPKGKKKILGESRKGTAGKKVILVIRRFGGLRLKKVD